MISVFSNYSFINAGFCDAKESLTQTNLLLMNQVHGADVVTLSKPFQESPSCDALVTKEKGLKLTVKTADCAPVLFVDPQAQIIGAAHAGWKGAFQGVLENTVLSMLKLGAHIESICCAVGPHLTLKNFQITEEMMKLFPSTEHLFFHSTEKGIYFDFSAYLKHRLERIGLSQIEISSLDTFSNLAYNSYRRGPKNKIRQYSFIEIK